jgi:preprotein translocase subunit SecY
MKNHRIRIVTNALIVAVLSVVVYRIGFFVPQPRIDHAQLQQWMAESGHALP